MNYESTFQDVLYPAIHESDSNWGIIITTAGLQSIAPDSAYPPKGHPNRYTFHTKKGRVLDEYQLVYVSKGEGVFSTKPGNGSIINEGTLFMLFPGEWHTYSPAENKGWDTYWVGFKGEYADHLAKQNYFSSKKPFWEIGYQEELVILFRSIIEQAKREEPGFQQSMGGIVCHLLGYLYQFRKGKNFTDKTVISKINKARILMRERATQITPEEIASDLNISYSWFRRAFKEYTGFGPGQYLAQLKIQKAKELLNHTQAPIKQIADKLNFESPDYFSVFFKRYTGQTPGQFRNKHPLK